MSGLFEDDSEVRKVKKPSAPKQKAEPKKRSKSVSDKLVEKSEGKGKLVELASSDSESSNQFEKIDLVKLKRSKSEKVDDELIEPPINYIE